jgi:hypothetical protein
MAQSPKSNAIVRVKMNTLYKCPYDKATSCDMQLPCLGCEDFKGKEKKTLEVTFLDDILPGYLKRSVGTSFVKYGGKRKENPISYDYTNRRMYD